ncbi:unnamed protein product, partial [Symbiodinium sp. KB8]
GSADPPRHRRRCHGPLPVASCSFQQGSRGSTSLQNRQPGRSRADRDLRALEDTAPAETHLGALVQRADRPPGEKAPCG